MTSWLQKLYWASPYTVKCLMASINARKLDRQRHNDYFNDWAEQFIYQNGWSSSQFEEYQKHRFQDILKLAVSHVPYYRALFRENNIDINDIRDFHDIGKLPILEKSVVRTQPESLLNETINRDELMRLSTSGTTGTPLRLYRTKHLNAAAFALNEARNHAVAGMCRRENRSVSIGGHLVASPNRKHPPFWVYNSRWDQLYMSSYHLSPDYLGFYVDKLRSFKADYIEGYPSSVAAIALYMVENKLPIVAFKACFTTAEVLTEFQRALIKKAFGCKTFSQYGCTELAVYAADCAEGHLHLSPEVSFVEVLDDQDKPVKPGQVGQLVCTTLMNTVQPLIRYKLGDAGSLMPSDYKCPCGLSMPILKTVEGRYDQLLMTRDGRRIGRLDSIYKGVDGIRESQIVQKAYDVFVIRVVPENSFCRNTEMQLIANLAERVGSANIRVEIADKIERTAAGKFRAVICELTGSNANQK